MVQQSTMDSYLGPKRPRIDTSTCTESDSDGHGSDGHGTHSQTLRHRLRKAKVYLLILANSIILYIFIYLFVGAPLLVVPNQLQGYMQVSVILISYSGKKIG